MQCVKQYMNKLEELSKIMIKYNLDTAEVDELINEIKYFRVSCPVIGNFSTGKSSLINAVLGKKLLSVDITPETAVPTEIFYGKNTVKRIDSKRLMPEEIDIESLPLKDLTIESTDLVTIELDNEFLKEIYNVKVVDLPGFDSGIELHNKAIDRYLPNSLAYVLVVATDEPVLKDNIEDFLTELDLQEMPLYVILTKCGRISEEEVESCKELIETIVKKLVKKSEVKIGVTESYGNVDVEDFKAFLYEVQKNAMQIFEKKYSIKLDNMINRVAKYLNDQLNKSGLTLSELDVQKEEVNKDINMLLNKIEKEKESFAAQTEECIKAIQTKVYADMANSIPGLAAMIQNGKNVNERVNTIVRNAVAVGIKTEFEPRLQKYLKKISSMISIDIRNDEEIKTNIAEFMTDNTIKEVTKKALPFALAVVGTVVMPGVGTVVGTMVGAFVDTMVNISQSKIREEKSYDVARSIVNTVTGQAVDAVAREIRSYLVQINEDMEKEILKQKEFLDRTFEDIEMRLAIEARDSKKFAQELKSDIEIIEKLQ